MRICDKCEYLVCVGKTQVQQRGTKWQRGGREYFHCHHPEILERTKYIRNKEGAVIGGGLYNFVGYRSAKPPYILTVETCKLWCPFRPKYEHIGVHRTHCCLEHGCKYGEEDCPVVNKLVVQTYPCYDCEHDYE